MWSFWEDIESLWFIHVEIWYISSFTGDLRWSSQGHKMWIGRFPTSQLIGQRIPVPEPTWSQPCFVALSTSNTMKDLDLYYSKDLSRTLTHSQGKWILVISLLRIWDLHDLSSHPFTMEISVMMQSIPLNGPVILTDIIGEGETTSERGPNKAPDAWAIPLSICRRRRHFEKHPNPARLLCHEAWTSPMPSITLGRPRCSQVVRIRS